MAVLEPKSADSVEEHDVGSNNADRVHGEVLDGTEHDTQDMQRMGKKQELRVSIVVILHWQLY